jgi:hypothetical protein
VVSGGTMDAEKISLEEAVFLYTKCKMDIAKKFRAGMNRQDFENFEKTLDYIDKSLEAEADRIAGTITDKSKG